MEWLWIIAGIIWAVYQLAKDSNTKQVPPNSDFIQANNDYYSGKCSAKEIDKRLKNGYYVKKDNE